MRIERLTGNSPYLDGAVDVLNDTFKNEYICKALLRDEPNADEIAYIRYRHYVTHAALDLDSWVAVDDDPAKKEVYGLMLVKAPGVDIAKTPNVETEYKRKLPGITPQVVMDAIKHLNDIEADLEHRTWGPDGPKDIYYLNFLCTSASARGQGVARRLLDPLLEEVAAKGAEIGLITHTDDNVTYYQRYGFRLRETVKGELRGTPVQYWSMSKP